MSVKTVPIRKTLFKYIDDNTSVDGHTSVPDHFDVEESDLVTWYDVEIADITGKATRVACEEVELELVLEVYSRHQTDMHAAAKVADELAAILGGKTLAVTDYDESGDPVIGTIRLREPDFQRTSLGQLQNIKIVVEGYYKEN